MHPNEQIFIKANVLFWWWMIPDQRTVNARLLCIINIYQFDNEWIQTRGICIPINCDTNEMHLIKHIFINLQSYFDSLAKCHQVRCTWWIEKSEVALSACYISYWPRREKTCLQGCWPSKTQTACSVTETSYDGEILPVSSLMIPNNKGTDQPAHLRLCCLLATKSGFLESGPICNTSLHNRSPDETDIKIGVFVLLWVFLCYGYSF